LKEHLSERLEHIDSMQQPLQEFNAMKLKVKSELNQVKVPLKNLNMSKEELGEKAVNLSSSQETNFKSRAFTQKVPSIQEQAYLSGS